MIYLLSLTLYKKNAIKVAVCGVGQEMKKGQAKRASTREIKSIDQNNALNRALWTLTEKMMQLKGA